ncbi:otoferlin [Augochlora pura]
MGNRKFRRNPYQVCVTILEARHLPQNASPLVVVKVGKQKRKTIVREKTDEPVYNEYFVFDLFCDLEELLSSRIVIAVYIKHYLRLKFYGSASFEVAIVWDQPDRQFYHKWAMLTNPKDLASGSKGYVKCNITINVKGEKMKVHPETDGEDDIEGNLLLPLGGASPAYRSHARYIFAIYRADGLPDMSSVCSKTDFENINPYVQISFAGMKGTTSEAWQTYGPRFNEKIIFREMFPSLCQRARIAIKHRVNSCQTSVVASRVLNLQKMSHSGDYGFLPTFGPSFLHFYGPGAAESSSCFGNTTTPVFNVLISIRQFHQPQHSLPDVFIWMISGSRRVACTRLPAEELIYSEDAIERGSKCGRKIDVFMRDPRDGDEADYAACKIEVYLWLGTTAYANASWSTVPSGYDVEHERNVDSFPKYVEYTSSAVFQLRAHIFQGRFDPGMDASGLLDPLVRVAFHGYSAATRAIKQTLDPFWDQTLILPPRTIHGTKDSIKRHPPRVVVEVYDQDICGIKEFCGRCTAIPLVKLAEETYSPPDFPPKLEWYKFKSQRDSTGSVLAAFELIEVGEDEATDEPISGAKQEIVYRIPEDIRPRMAGYRLEVIFWGVRDMKKINYVPVLRPRIIVECAGVDVKSEVMENAKKFSNFEEPRIVVDLDMPELEVYYPSVTIKAYDSRGFGCFKYAGICIVPSVHVFLEQLITEEDYDAQIHETKLKSLWTKKQSVILPLPVDYDSTRDENKGLIPYKKMSGGGGGEDSPLRILGILRSLKKLFARLLNTGARRKKRKRAERAKVEDESLDWWNREECLALNVLHHWHDFPICGCTLVPEHVERRPLFNAAKPGLEQGKLELWIDMFQFGELPPRPASDIRPPIPQEYEIRVIVWNTEDVPLVDSQFLTGEKCSDVYVKGWILYDDYQKTDVHYNSLNGEGNFNWRFVFRVTYSKGERIMVVRRKMSVLARSETEDKLPCKLQLQVWDSDHFSPDDFLGALSMDLSRMPRGSPNSKNCTMKLLDPKLPTMDLFKVTRIKAWWPFQKSVGTGEFVQAGKVELEMSILPAQEADEQPAGRGRDPPQELPPPNRPDTSFSWFRNPLKAFRYVVCRYYKWHILCSLLILLLLLLVAVGIYAFPGYLVKRILGA